MTQVVTRATRSLKERCGATRTPRAIADRLSVSSGSAACHREDLSLFRHSDESEVEIRPEAGERTLDPGHRPSGGRGAATLPGLVREREMIRDDPADPPAVALHQVAER